MASYQQIVNATYNYTKQLHEYDMGLIIKAMVRNYGLESQVYTFPYPGTIPLGKNVSAFDIYNYQTNLGEFGKLWEINKNFRYNIGIFSIPMIGDQEHYMALFMDNKEESIMVWDSIVTNETELENEISIFKQIYPDYIIFGPNVCSGCKTYQTLNEWYEQNIFCHTWALWFVDQVLYALTKGFDFEHITYLFADDLCRSEVQNLITIKTFAKHLAINYLDYKPQKAFSYILNLNSDKIIQIPNREIHNWIKLYED